MFGWGSFLGVVATTLIVYIFGYMERTYTYVPIEIFYVSGEFNFK